MGQINENVGDFGNAGQQAFADVNNSAEPAVSTPPPEAAVAPSTPETAVAPPAEPAAAPAAEPSGEPSTTPSYLEEPAPLAPQETTSVTWDDASYDLTQEQINALAYRGYRQLLADQQGGGQEPAAPEAPPAPVQPGAPPNPNDPMSVLTNQVQALTQQLQQQQQAIQQNQINEQTRQINAEIDSETSKYQIFKDSPDLLASARETVYAKLYSKPGATTAQTVREVATNLEKGVRAIHQQYLSGKVASSQATEGGSSMAATPGAKPLTKEDLFNGGVRRAVMADVANARNSQG